MKKWEYKWDSVSNFFSIIDHQELLLKRSEEGWELVSVLMIKEGTSGIMRLYWKREII